MTQFEQMKGITLQWVKVKDLTVHPKIQRKFREQRAQKLLAEFDPERLTPLMANKEGGRLLVYEGQHRLWAISHWLNGGAGEQKIAVWVRDNADHSVLAGDRLATDSQMKMTPVDRFLMEVAHDVSEAQAVRAVLAKHGLSVAQVSGNGIVQCVGAFRRIVSRPGGVKMLERVIGLLSTAFGKSPDGYHRDIVAALGLLVFKFGPKIEDAGIIRALTAGHKGAPGIVAAGKQVAAGVGGGAVHGVILCLLRNYNKGRKVRLSWDG